jgi:hypothetical protein
MDADRFLLLYRARWGDPPEVRDNPEAITLWKSKMVDALPDALADRVFDKVDELRGGSYARPRIGAFQAAMRALEVHAYEPGSAYCPHCYGGQLLVMGYRDGDRHVASAELVAGHEPAVNGLDGLHLFTVPCACDAGHKVAPGRDRARATFALDWVIARKREWGIDADTFLADGVTTQERWGRAMNTRLCEICDQAKAQKAGKDTSHETRTA